MRGSFHFAFEYWPQNIMWSRLSLFLIVGVAVSYCDHHTNLETHEHECAWNTGDQYKYQFLSKTMTVLEDPKQRATGILIKGVLVVQALTPDTLNAQIRNMQYASVEEDGSQIKSEDTPPIALTFRNVTMSEHPVQIIVKDGVIRDLLVNEKTPIWEVNMMKSILSQLQVDTRGKNVIPSKYNQMSEDDERPYALYKVMEDSVGGNCEVLYDVVPMSEDVISNRPELIPMPRLDNRNFIEIRKTKDFKNCKQQRTYYYNQTNQRMNWQHVASESNGKSVSQTSWTRMILSGNLNHFTIQSSTTRSNIFITSDQKDSVIGNVYSTINLTLVERNNEFKPLEPTNVVSTENLVYTHRDSFLQAESLRPVQGIPQVQSSRHSSNEAHMSGRVPTSRKDLEDLFNRDSRSSSSSSSSSEERTDSEPLPIDSEWLPNLNEPLKDPLLPIFIGISGTNISKDIEIIIREAAANLIVQIAEGIRDSLTRESDETIERFTIVQDLLRNMNVEQLIDVERLVFTRPKISNGLLQTIRKVFHKTVAQIGTGPALLRLVEWIKSKELKDVDASMLLMRIPKTVRTPTANYMREFYEMISMPEMMNREFLNVSAPLAFAELIRNVQNDKKNYPVDSYGRMRLSNDELEKYISHLARQLREAVQKDNSLRIHTYITALSFTSHPKILSVFEPFLEGKQRISDCQRVTMVLGLARLLKTYPKLTRSILYKIYSNTNEDDQIRVAAFYSIIKTDPPLPIYMRIAQFTNYDRSTRVNSAVTSVIRSLANLKSMNAQNIALKARLARKLLINKHYTLPNSKGYYADSDNKNDMIRSTYFATIGKESDESDYAEAGLYIVNDFIRLNNFRFGYGMSDFKQVWDFFDSYYTMFDSKQESQKKTPVEEIMRALDMKPFVRKQLEGYIFSSTKYETRFYPFDKDTLQRVIDRMLDTDLSQTIEDFRLDAMYNHDEVVSIVTESGLPFTHTIQTPIVMQFTPKNPEIALDSVSKNIASELPMLFASKVQNRWGFTVPFELKVYLAGVDRDFHLHLPLEIRLKEQSNEDRFDLHLRMTPMPSEQDHKVMHFRTVSFTTQRDILTFEPLSHDKEIRNDSQTAQHNSYRMGVISVTTESDKEVMPTSKDVINTFMSSNQKDNHYRKIEVSVDRDAASKGIHMNITHVKSSTNNPTNQQFDLEKLIVIDGQPNSEARRKQFLTEVSKGTQSSHNHVWDIDIEYPTLQRQERQVITLAMGHSHVEEKYRTIFYGNIQPAMGRNIDYEALGTGTMELSQQTPLDFKRMLDHEQQDNIEIVLRYGKNYVNGEKIHIYGNMTQSKDLKNMLRNNEITKECLKNTLQGKESQACQEATQFVQRKDLMKLSIVTDTPVQSEIIDHIREIVHRIFDKVVEKVNRRSDKKDTIDMKLKLPLDHDQTDVFISSYDKDITFSIFNPSDTQRQMPSELSPLISRFSSQEPIKVLKQLASGLSSEWPSELQSLLKPTMNLLLFKKQIDSLASDPQQLSCFIGKTQIITFDNKLYPNHHDENWHIFLIPKTQSDSDEGIIEIPENMKITVLIREMEDSKQLRVFLGNKEIGIWKTNDGIEVLIDKQQVKHYKTEDKRDTTSYEDRHNGELYVQIYELPDKSVNLRSDKYGLNIVYSKDALIQIEIANHYMNKLDGLCGNYDYQPDNDFMVAQNCIAQKPEEFSAFYTLIENGHQGYTAPNKDKQVPCVPSMQSHHQSNVISDIEAGRSPTNWTPYSNNPFHRGSSKENQNSTESPITYRTKVEERDNEICFSTKPVPSCEHTLPTRTKVKTYQYFCMPRNEASEQLKRRIEQGANPDFSQKTVEFTKSYEVPFACRAA